jgi:Rrf2 family protein
MLKISDAANLALHAMAALACTNGGGQTSVNQLAERLGVSEHHLAKVMQRLGKIGLVKSRRGPKGGFTLGRDPDTIHLIEIYEAIEGPMPERECLLDRQVCDGTHCLMGDLIQSVDRQVRDHMQNTKLTDMGQTFLAMGEKK